jgi:hypothetical protein
VLSDAVATGLPELLALLDPASTPPPRGQTPPRSGEDSAVPLHPLRGLAPQRSCDGGDRAVEAAILGEGGGPAALLARAGHEVQVDRLGVQARGALAVLLAQPGASGAEVQRALGHRHASQTSRLLHRLRGQGLVAVTGGARRSGWSLTRAGRIAAHKRIT